MANTALPWAGRTPLRASRAISVSGPPLPPGVAHMANSVDITTPMLFSPPMRPRCSPSSRRKRTEFKPQHSTIMPSMASSSDNGKRCTRDHISPPPTSSGTSSAVSRAAPSQISRFMRRC
ncbi:hypothetical protein D3C84_880120 [compost metagenome]